MSDRSKGRPCQPQTAFQIASVSKQMTAAAVLRLAERGSLTVEDPLSRWFPGVPRWREITVHRLLTHTAGLKTWEDLPRLSLYRNIGERRVLRAFAIARLALAPGTAFRYSSPGYVLLAHIVAREAGRPYDQVMRMMFDEAGMVNTGAGAQSPFPGRDALGYRGRRRRPSFDLVTVGKGAGDIWSTIDDLLQWDRALFSGRLLRAATLESALRPHANVPVEQPGPRSIAYGYAWIIYDTANGPIWFHTGHNAGFSAINAVFPQDDLCVIVLSNEEMTDVRAICSQLRAETVAT